ncbi:hypothetical protein PMSD_00900 [Paenibacillus macquariensis subsp. defensor]|nr:hypothetical protein PMSD_00900 [Paenibacillus macquariensis subsp. defensor]
MVVIPCSITHCFSLKKRLIKREIGIFKTSLVQIKSHLPPKERSPQLDISKQFFFEEAVVNKSKKMVRTLTKINRDGTQKKVIATLAEGDRFISELGTTFVFKTNSGKIYQIGKDGKDTEPTK